MTLPASGPITIGMVAAELGIGVPLSLGDSRVRALAGIPSGPISLGSLRGKSASGPMGGSVPNLSMSAQSNPGTSYNATDTITANIAGGTGPYTYAWSKVSGSGSVDATNAPSTTVRMPVARFSQPGDTSTQVVQLVVTDSKGASITRQATVTLTLY